MRVELHCRHNVSRWAYYNCWLSGVWWVEGTCMSLIESHKLVLARDVEVRV